MEDGLISENDLYIGKQVPEFTIGTPFLPNWSEFLAGARTGFDLQTVQNQCAGDPQLDHIITSFLSIFLSFGATLELVFVVGASPFDVRKQRIG